MAYPSDRKYTKEHEWAKKDGSSVLIGVTEHAQSSLGDVVFVDLPAAGRTLKQNETFGAVESIKAVSDLYAPLSGKVLAINEQTKNDPSLINRAAHGDAWLIRLEPSAPAEFDSLMDAPTYEAYVKTLA